MRSHPKLKNPPRPLFSCGIFGHCTQTVLSPTTPQAPTFPLPSESEHPPPRPDHPPSSSSSSSSTSQSFTQWKFPLPKPPLLHLPTPESDPAFEYGKFGSSGPSPRPPSFNMAEIFHVAELQISSDSEPARLAGLHLLERSLLLDPLPDDSADCPPAVMGAVVGFLNIPLASRAATKVLLALCLAEANRRAAVEAGAASAVLETVTDLEVSAAERALAALELLCTVPEGAAEVKGHALAVPALVEMVGKMSGRGKECAISVLAAIYGGAEGPPGTVARAVAMALQGECSARGRRKGAQLLKAVQENGRQDHMVEGR